MTYPSSRNAAVRVLVKDLRILWSFDKLEVDVVATKAAYFGHLGDDFQHPMARSEGGGRLR